MSPRERAKALGWVRDDVHGGARRHSWHDAPVRETARRLGKGEYPHEVGGDTTVLRVGKKAAGRLLDGVLHDGFPEVSRG